MTELYLCPKCNAGLLLEPLKKKFYQCINKHTFDIAKEGYVNLHLVENKKSKMPGDDTQMTKSRQAFLNKGYYRLMANGIVAAVEQCLNKDKVKILDVGCGEGYYLEAMHRAFFNAELSGMDISKSAVKLAAKRKLNAEFAVASAFDLPYQNNYFDCVISVFSPICPVQAARVLRDGGYLIMAGPGPKHLQGLAAKIYDNLTEHQGNFAVLDCDQFQRVDSKTVEFIAEVAQDDIANLLRMMPYYWHARPEQQQALYRLPELITPLVFEIHTYKRSVT